MTTIDVMEKDKHRFIVVLVVVIFTICFRHGMAWLATTVL